MTELTGTPNVMTTTISAIGKKTVQFMPKPTSSNSTKLVALIQKLILTVPTTDVQGDKEVVIITNDNEVTLTEDEIGNLFQDSFSEEDLGTE